MSSLRVRYQTIEFGEVDIHLRTLRDNQEFQDKDGEAEKLGISSASWPLFGVVWDAGKVLAHHMCDYDITQAIGKRYRRQDEIGTPYCVTIDFDSLEDDAVTVRERDSMEQERVATDELVPRHLLFEGQHLLE